MKTWQALLLVILLVTMPVISACDLFGGGKSKAEREQEYYQQQLDAIREAQEIQRQQIAEQNQRLQEALQEYVDEYQKWQEDQIKQQMGQMGLTTTDNQS